MPLVAPTASVARPAWTTSLLLMDEVLPFVFLIRRMSRPVFLRPFLGWGRISGRTLATFAQSVESPIGWHVGPDMPSRLVIYGVLVSLTRCLLVSPSRQALIRSLTERNL